MSGETNRNSRTLSRHNPSRIKELQDIAGMEHGWSLWARPSTTFDLNFSNRLLTGLGMALYCFNS